MDSVVLLLLCVAEGDEERWMSGSQRAMGGATAGAFLVF